MFYGYIRVSSDKQTVENQRFEIKRFAEEKGVEIDGWIEETISGTKNYDKRRLGKLLNKVNLLDKKDKFPRQLSGGQQQRVAIARALNKEGNLLLFDEPTGALDEASGITILELIKELHDEGKTIILVTHTKEIGLISDRIVTMKDGKIVSNQENNNPIPVKEVHW